MSLAYEIAAVRRIVLDFRATQALDWAVHRNEIGRQPGVRQPV
jgi:hypothetical protein